MIQRKDKILGGLLGAAVGDALGALTETYTPAMIKEVYGHYITDFETPAPDILSTGTEGGMVTDDFSCAYYTAEEMLAANSHITKEIAEKALVRWWDHPEYTRYAGPSTGRKVAELTGIPDPKPHHGFVFDPWLLCAGFRATNGAGMKSGVIGLFNPGNVDKAIDDAITMCLVTHDNVISLSAGCAVAAATAEAMKPNASWRDVLNAGVYGAGEGYLRSMPIARPAAGPSVEKRIQLAIELGLRHQGDFETALDQIRGTIGNGLFAYEAIPAAFGAIAACKGDAMDSVLMCVNMGNDSDSTACPAGFIVGALQGAGAYPRRFMTHIDKLNHFDLEGTAAQIDAFLTAKEAE